MKDYCFFTCYDPVYEKTAKGLVNSVHKFYPNADFFEFVLPRTGGFDLKDFCDFHLAVGEDLLKTYKRIISLDPDEIMCAECPDLFGNFDLGVVKNNIPLGITEFDNWVRGTIYINAGMTVCTNVEVWQEWMREYEKRCIKYPGEPLNEQNALNNVFHTSRFKVDLLEFPDRVYGISAMNYGYANMYLRDDGLWVKWKAGEQWHDQKLCLFHAAGVEWKIKETGEIKYDKIENKLARLLLRSYTC